MSSIVLSPGATGAAAFTIEAPSTATSRVITLPDATDTLVGKATTDTLTNKSIAATQLTGSVAVANGGTGLTALGPAFSAYMASNQSVSSSVLTKLTLNTETFDTANVFDSVTNYRFTPNVAGYYQVSMALQMNSSTTAAVLNLYKNGSSYTLTVYYQGAGVSTQYPLTALLYLNGSTDYIEFYGQTNGGTTLGGGATGTFASAFLARPA